MLSLTEILPRSLSREMPCGIGYLGASRDGLIAGTGLPPIREHEVFPITRFGA
jgi:hypothetical protein